MMRTIKDITDEILMNPQMAAYDYWKRDGDDACFHLLRHYLKEGQGVDLAETQHDAARQVSEVWWHTDAMPIEEVWHPWRLALFGIENPWVDHLGLIVDAADFIHIRPRLGVCKEPIRRWMHKLLQIVELSPAWLKAP